MRAHRGQQQRHEQQQQRHEQQQQPHEQQQQRLEQCRAAAAVRRGQSQCGRASAAILLAMVRVSDGGLLGVRVVDDLDTAHILQLLDDCHTATLRSELLAA